MFQNVPGIYWAISALLTLSSGTKEKKCCCVLPFLRHFHTKQRQSGGQSAGRSPFQTPPVPQIRPNIFLSFFFFFYKFSTLIWKKTQVNRTGEKGETFICYSAGRSQSRAGRQRAAGSQKLENSSWLSGRRKWRHKFIKAPTGGAVRWETFSEENCFFFLCFTCFFPPCLTCSHTLKGVEKLDDFYFNCKVFVCSHFDSFEDQLKINWLVV